MLSLTKHPNSNRRTLRERLAPFGPWLDVWTPRLLKVFGVVGFGLALVLAALGQVYPVLLGTSLMAGSGGYVSDALTASRSGRE